MYTLTTAGHALEALSDRKIVESDLTGNQYKKGFCSSLWVKKCGSTTWIITDHILFAELNKKWIIKVDSF